MGVDGGQIWVAVNLSASTGEISPPPGLWKALGTEIEAAPLAQGKLALGPWQFALYSAT